MLDLGWIEMAVIAIIALLVIGPKDLPKAIKAVSEFAGKARSLAREFRAGLDDIVRETELDKFKEDIEKTTRIDAVGDDAWETADESGSDYDYTNSIGDWQAGPARWEDVHRRATSKKLRKSKSAPEYKSRKSKPSTPREGPVPPRRRSRP
ncbi:MAG: Sec-independent protein translocase protein TatB [Pseudomonadota bacterium]